MFYRAENKFTGEVWEDEEFRAVYEAAITSAKKDLRVEPWQYFVGIRLFTVENAVAIVDDNTGKVHTCYIGKKHYGYVTVTRDAVNTVIYGQGYCEVKREG